jgi:hypothetical protein
MNLGANAFVDPSVGALVPFNVQTLGADIYVLCAGRACCPDGGPRRNRRRFGIRYEREPGPIADCRQQARFAVGHYSRSGELRTVQRRPAGRQLQLRRERDQRFRSVHRSVPWNDSDQHRRQRAGRALGSQRREWSERRPHEHRLLCRRAQRRNEWAVRQHRRRSARACFVGAAGTGTPRSRLLQAQELRYREKVRMRCG